jgi:Putative auto-transporter adhesin, head GIN domain
MKMKKITFIILAIFICTLSFSQKKDKIKGSKIVTVEQKQIGAFDTLEVEDNLEVFLVKGEKCGVEIEADDNLHEVISIDLNGSTLRLTALRYVSSAKKFSIRVTYTDDFKMVTAKNEATISALSEIGLNDITFKSFDYAKLFINARTKNFTLLANDKSKAELNLKTENGTIELSKNAHVKALITSVNLKFDLYQKSDAEVEGDIIDMKLRLDNNSDFMGKKLNVKNMQLITEAYSNCRINVNTNLSITSSGNSEIELYGDQKIDMQKFVDNSKLTKKLTK